MGGLCPSNFNWKNWNWKEYQVMVSYSFSTRPSKWRSSSTSSWQNFL